MKRGMCLNGVIAVAQVRRGLGKGRGKKTVVVVLPLLAES